MLNKVRASNLTQTVNEQFINGIFQQTFVDNRTIRVLN